ncbi:unnamed protein product [Pleuronectes platessa]|uniref:Uncharacterized protein n=1 Tax=Pleuronectes platessa TaxID=8262 RepID=A0A9N7UMJ4_PLEPL|nr:unnamed protein product [Pleuronectes platessa]
MNLAKGQGQSATDSEKHTEAFTPVLGLIFAEPKKQCGQMRVPSLPLGALYLRAPSPPSGALSTPIYGGSGLLLALSLAPLPRFWTLVGEQGSVVGCAHRLGHLIHCIYRTGVRHRIAPPGETSTVARQQAKATRLG